MKRKMSTHTAALRLARGGLITALYVVLTYLSNFLGLASGVIQFRISEALCILPIFMPEAIPGLSLGCLLANFLTGCALWDVIFGTVATFIGAIGAYMLRRMRFRFVATLPTVMSNALIIPFVLIYAYGAEGSYLFFMATVAIGEIVCAGILGTLLAHGLKNSRMFNK